eukprot:EG_transcript_27016
MQSCPHPNVSQGYPILSQKIPTTKPKLILIHHTNKKQGSTQPPPSDYTGRGKANPVQPLGNKKTDTQPLAPWELTSLNQVLPIVWAIGPKARWRSALTLPNDVSTVMIQLDMSSNVDVSSKSFNKSLNFFEQVTNLKFSKSVVLILANC